MGENMNGKWKLFGMLGCNRGLGNKKYRMKRFRMGGYNKIVSYMRDGEGENV